MMDSNQVDLSALLKASIDSLDITPEQYELAVGRYEDLGGWLVEQGVGEPEVYPQGSFRLGTVVRPSAESDFDIDLVFLRPINRNSTTQAEVREQAGDLLKGYVKARGSLVGNPQIEEKGRCWCLCYDDDQLHMDVLPVIPDDEGDETSILLTDKDLRLWQHSNPIGYANWFWAAMGETAEEARASLAILMDRNVEDVPRWLVRTALQRAVQIAKRHRDIFFEEHPDDKPASILLTTLITHTYDGQTSLYETLQVAAAKMTQAVERRSDGLWVANPAHPSENFADKWNTDPSRKRHFDDWLEEFQADVQGWQAPRGLPDVAAALDRSLGDGFGGAGVKALGATLRKATAEGKATISSTGLAVGSAGGVRVPKHTFHLE